MAARSGYSNVSRVLRVRSAITVFSCGDRARAASDFSVFNILLQKLQASNHFAQTEPAPAHLGARSAISSMPSIAFAVEIDR